MKRPLQHSYWIEPGKLLAGEYPRGRDNASTRRRLARLHEAGIRHFVDLTQPGELKGYEALLPEDTTYRNFPIPDHAVPPSAAALRGLLQELAARHGEPGAIYVHCRAGIGRTGTLVGCWLRERGAGPDEALARLNEAWQQDARAPAWPSIPETDEQYHYVRDWQTDAPAPTAGPRADAGEDRWQAGLLGLALGDALAGVASTMGEASLRWGDDTAMALCAADSLLARKGFDGRDQVERYLAWQRDPAGAGADPSATLRPVVRSALLRALRSRAPFQGSLDPAVTDGSPLARAAMAALFAPRQATALAEDLTRVTHQVALVVDACCLFANLVAGVLAGSLDRRQALVAAMEAAPASRPDVLQAVEDATGADGAALAATGILGALAHAVHAFLHIDDMAAGFEWLRRVPADDRDAAMAAYGMLAGTWQGTAGLPQPWLARLAGRERLQQLALRLHARAGADTDA